MAYFSDDGGKTWTAQKTGTEDRLLKIGIADDQRAAVAASDGTLLNTADGGKMPPCCGCGWHSTMVALRSVAGEGTSTAHSSFPTGPRKKNSLRPAGNDSGDSTGETSIITCSVSGAG